VRLFATPLSLSSSLKYRDEIFVRGEGSDIPSFHCSHFSVIYSGSSCKLLRIKNNGTWLKFEFKFKPSLFYSQNKSRRTCKETLILSYNHANLNPYSRRARQIRILGNLSDFSKQVWIPNKFKSNSKSVWLPGFLIQILFQI
jgi:hypothetical protein